MMNDPLITNDAVVFGLLIGILALVFISSESKHPVWATIYKYVPTLLPATSFHLFLLIQLESFQGKNLSYISLHLDTYCHQA